MEDKSNKTTRRTKSPSSSPMSAEEKLKQNLKSKSTKPRTKKTTTTKTTKSTTSLASTKSTPSAEEKLKKSMKGLSHLGGGGGSLNFGTSTTTKSKSSSERKKVGGVVLDLETIEDAHKQKFETKGRRNNVIILVLSLLLVVSLVYLVIAIMGYNKSKKEPNLRYYVDGTASASWVIDGQSKTKFIMQSGLEPDTIFNVDSRLNIHTTQSVSITLNIKVLLDGAEILIAGLQDADVNFIRVENTNKFVYQSSIVGGGTIRAFSGIDFSDAPSNLKSSNVIIEITATVNLV